MLRRFINLGGKDQRRCREMLKGRHDKPRENAADDAGRQNARNHERA